jgi:FMN phosphatase YigB (HAD superfamily)
VVSNGSLELNAYRFRTFKLDGFVDSFISSCFVYLREPDVNIFRLALDITQTPANQVLYIETTPMFVHVAEGLGIRSLATDDKMIVELPAILVPEAEPLTDMEKTFSSVVEKNDEVPANAMDEYPEYWIG